MSYESAMAYPAAAAGPWGQSAADAAYYQQYYSAYGYGGGYDMSGYYQQHYAAPGSGPTSQLESKSYSLETAKPPGAPVPPLPETSVANSVAAPSTPATAGTSNGQESDPPPPPEAPPPPPPSEGPDAIKNSQQASEQSGNPGAHASSASVPYDSAAYAQWYQQTYGPYYASYAGYNEQMYAYWHHQQQQAEAYAYAANAHVSAPHAIPPPAPPKGDPPPASGRTNRLHSKPQAPAADAYNAQPPPSGLYLQHSSFQGRQKLGPTGPNTVPIGQHTSSAGDATTLQGNKPQLALTIRPQLPASKRASIVAAAPAYISVGSKSSSVAVASQPADNGKDPAVAAAVAAGAASAAAAAAAAKTAQSTAPGQKVATGSQWPPSFTAWVTRCFNAARHNKIPDTCLSEKLMAYLDRVKAEGKLWTTDWDTLPIMLPDTPSEQSAGTVSVLSLGEGLTVRKRQRWGAPPEHANQDTVNVATREAHLDSRQPSGSRKRSLASADSDEQYVGGGGSGRTTHKAGITGLLSNPHLLSNRKRKKALRQEQMALGGQRISGGSGGIGDYLTAEEMRYRARACRFGDGRAAGGAEGSSSGMDLSEPEASSDDDMLASASVRRRGGTIGGKGSVVVGTCQALEKSYFRLTSQPDPSSVRPEPVLERALDRLVGLIARREATYFYALDQFKGMRQDCTVQHLRNALAVRVYEAHGRSSLEYADTAEFNQCQARLGHLYAEGQPGCIAEFTAYRLLYETVHCAIIAGEGRKGSSGGCGGMGKALLHTMRNMPREAVGSVEVRHALQVREAVFTNNYTAFFRLYASAPNMGRAIMDVIADVMRWNGLNAFVKACDPPLPVADVARLLGFVARPHTGSSEVQRVAQEKQVSPLPGCSRGHFVGDAAPADSLEDGLAECADWLREHGAVILQKGSELLLDAKASRGKLFVPEVSAKVAHGDENLSLTDFLAQAQRSLAA